MLAWASVRECHLIRLRVRLGAHPLERPLTDADACLGCCVSQIMGHRAITPGRARTLARATRFGASVGAVLSIAWWAFPALANATGVAVMLVGFVFTLAGMLLVTTARGRRLPPWTLRPGILRPRGRAPLRSAASRTLDLRAYCE